MDTTADAYLFGRTPMLLNGLKVLAWLLGQGIAAAALVVASFAYYRVHVRGPIIPAGSTERQAWLPGPSMG
jgi:hypothetical protein